MKYFTVIYRMPPQGLEAWMQKPEDERKAEEEPLRLEWNTWLEAHKAQVLNTIGLGQTKEVSAAGVQDIKNGLMLSSYVTAETLEDAAALFVDHPHLKIPEATIEVMEANQLTQM